MGEAKNRQHPSSSISQHHPQHQLPCNEMGSRVDEGRGLQLVCMQPTPLHAAIQVLTCMQGGLNAIFCTQRCTMAIKNCAAALPSIHAAAPPLLPAPKLVGIVTKLKGNLLAVPWIIASTVGRCCVVVIERFGELLTAHIFDLFNIICKHSPNLSSHCPNRLASFCAVGLSQ